MRTDNRPLIINHRSFVFYLVPLGRQRPCVVIIHPFGHDLRKVLRFIGFWDVTILFCKGFWGVKGVIRFVVARASWCFQQGRWLYVARFADFYVFLVWRKIEGQFIFLCCWRCLLLIVSWEDFSFSFLSVLKISLE